MPPPLATEHATVPLCVDLDGTVIKTDLTWESLVRLLRRNFFYLFLVPFWLIRGRACLKRQVAARTGVDVTTLPYHEPFLAFLRDEQRSGRQILLVTASDQELAKTVSDHLGVFTEVMGSDGRNNLRGINKGTVLAERFGRQGFDYAGNSHVDLPVWEQARQAIVVDGSSRLADRARQRATVARVFEAPGSPWAALLNALRPHQWVKNLILFVPLVTAHKIMEAPLLGDAILAFVAFCLCSSAVYILNDLLDLDADRHHPSKRLRPFASGNLHLAAGFVACPLLLAASGALASGLIWSFAAVLVLYFILTTSYSWRFKQVPLVDVFCLAGLYTLRLIAGHEATGVAYSFWLLVFSMFIFLSLALVKRFREVSAARQENRADIKGRGYAAGDVELVATLGTTSGYLAVLVLALYVNSQEVRVLYRHPTLLLLICPLLLYWISRVWMIAHRGQMHDDPIVFALKDRVSYAVGALTLVVLWLATGH